MSNVPRILGVVADPDGLDWLWAALEQDHGRSLSDEERTIFGPRDLPEELDAYDAAVLDESIGPENARLVLADLLRERAAMPVLVGVDAEDRANWEAMMRLGVQDILFRDQDQPAELMRRISGAIHHARVLYATQEAEIRLRTIIENIEDGVLILDSHSVILFANPAAEDLLDRPLNELFGLIIPFIVPNKGEDTIEIGIDPVRTLHVRSHEITWEGQDALLITLRDITAEQEIRNQLRLARKTAEEASAMKSTFLANMSHELRMPLASIIGFAQLIREGTDNADFQEFSEAIEESGNRLLKTINAVLEATRLEKQHIDPLLDAVRVDTVVEEVVTNLQPLVQGDGVTLSFEGTGAPYVMADEDFLVRILNNLIGNAAKFTDEGSIVVSWKDLGNKVMIRVADTGCGISPEFIPHLFDEFSQESTGPGRTHEGTGLGLTIVKGLVDLLEGRIEVQSEPGKGSTFSVYIPAAFPPST